MLVIKLNKTHHMVLNLIIQRGGSVPASFLLEKFSKIGLRNIMSELRASRTIKDFRIDYQFNLVSIQMWE